MTKGREYVLNNLIYTTVEGDTFDIIALDFYNDEYLSKHIIDANPDHAKTINFKAGVKIIIPVIKKPVSSNTLPPWQR